MRRIIRIHNIELIEASSGIEVEYECCSPNHETSGLSMILYDFESNRPVYHILIYPGFPSLNKDNFHISFDLSVTVLRLNRE